MKKMIMVALAVMIISGLALAQQNPWAAAAWSTTVPGGVTVPAKGFTIDKLGAHQNGGRGCVGCHAPHSGSRGNGGALTLTSTSSAGANGKVVWSNMAADDATVAKGDEILWGQDLEPIYAHTFTFPVNPDNATSNNVLTIDTKSDRQVTGIATCLSCHDGNYAKGAMMTNQSFEQAAGMLPSGYGSNSIPTLLGNDGGPSGNYLNDHPVGPYAKLGDVGHGAINAAKGFFTVGSSNGTPIVAKGAGFTGSTMAKFWSNYGLPTIIDARAGAGWALEATETNVDNAYVVCTTCHTPHSMYTTSAKLGGVSKGTVPTFFFIAAGYNPGANVADGTKASSATQFCRQCHFSGPGGANEASGIDIPTAF